ncbi:hypothetical protein CFK37_04300 [Virgibacillus phasianinus]|uniref:DUF2269 domain-containing protein n=1 Tax=Virgibacillus phasianinus TaxID=2017483 RepID=A0A220U065_9BACI|nr:DUF2269 family protein [Virgibacillus phasianinus]ASK61450.1 hypothetical protein CFK37_04300 [Virgibacillus phasianinus]
MTLYTVLVFIHIISAIVGLGPGFVMIYIVTNAANMNELRHAYAIRHRLHIFVMVGGTLLLITGLLMGVINPMLFQMGWYITSLLLFLIALSFGPALLAPSFRPIKDMLDNHIGNEIPQEYFLLARKLFFYERIENAIFLIVIALMITKPF